jgi:hypothetical protein
MPIKLPLGLGIKIKSSSTFSTKTLKYMVDGEWIPLALALINIPSDLSSIASFDTITANSAFSSTPSGETHQSSEWEISENSAFTTGVTSSGVVSGSERTEFTFTGLTESTTYYWRVRHQGGNGVWSDWTSAQTQDTTAVIINTPTGLSSSATTSSITSNSSFSATPSGGATHQASEWQRATNTSFTSGLVGSGVVTGSQRTQFTFTGLSAGTTYYWRVRHQGSNGLWSNWTSAQTRATTAMSIGSVIDGQWLIYADGGSFWRAIRCDSGALAQRQWGGYGSTTGATSTTDGPGNTAKMPTGTTARSWVESKGGYLPAIDELAQIGSNIAFINANSSSPISTAGMDPGWSSTENSANDAGMYSFFDLSPFITDKDINIGWCIPVKRISK